MSVGVALLLCDNTGEARVLANELDALNQTRKEIEQGMQAEALTLCEKLERSGETLPGGLAMYHPQWHQGVVGILASRIKERFHRPVIAFAPTGDGTLKGSVDSGAAYARCAGASGYALSRADSEVWRPCHGGGYRWKRRALKSSSSASASW
jgi:single-stranded DNA-specific DHH superfamily exonuclease